jgi:hypothetical protein
MSPPLGAHELKRPDQDTLGISGSAGSQMENRLGFVTFEHLFDLP